MKQRMHQACAESYVSNIHIWQLTGYNSVFPQQILTTIVSFLNELLPRSTFGRYNIYTVAYHF